MNSLLQRFSAVLLIAALPFSLLSCRPTLGGGAFAASLASLDTLIASRDVSKLDGAFSLSYRKSRTASDWLSILKRAKAAEAIGEAGRYTGSADRARKAFPSSEAIAAASALAYLRDGRPADALSLFGGPISLAVRPNLWAEAFLATPASLDRPAAKSEDFARLADVTGDPRALLGAAALSLAASDQASARSWLRKAIARGSEPPLELLWDSGLYQDLADRPEPGSSAYELALMGDAAWMAGDANLANRRWARSINLEPRRSWKPYVNLAFMSRDSGETADSYWARLKAAFLSGPASDLRDGALAAYAAELARKGRDAEALRALSGGGASGDERSLRGERSPRLAILSLAIEGKSMPEARLVARFERLAADMPGDPMIQGAALRALALRGLYGELALLREASVKTRLPIPYGWYYDAVVAAVKGDYPGAAATIVAATGGSSGAAGSFALGSLYGELGDPARSAAAYSLAASAARGAVESRAAYTALGRALGATGDPEGAARAFKSALEADPSDPEAAILSRSGPEARARSGPEARAALRAEVE